MDQSMQRLRELDIDDFIVMKLMSEDVKGSVIAKTLGLTPPAVSHRRKKFAKVFDDFYEITEVDPYKKKLTANGEAICKKMASVLKVLAGEDKETALRG